MNKGIDVSQYNGNIDWEKVKNDGIKFAIIRLGIGSDIQSQDDKKFRENCKGAELVGIPYGIYIYSYALNDNDLQSEINHAVRLAKQVNPTLGVFFDMEDADGYKKKHGLNPYANRSKLTNFCLDFMRGVSAFGYKVGVYANYDYFKNVLNYEAIKSQGLIWYAHWGIINPMLDCTIWQYASNGRVSGISGNVDMNYSYMSLSDTGTPEIPKEVVSYYPKYTGNLPLASALSSLGIDSSFSNRSKIAVNNGICSSINEYAGSYDQNIKMLNLLKSGQLKKGELI